MSSLRIVPLCATLFLACGEPDLPKIIDDPDDTPPPTSPGDRHIAAAVEAALRQAGGIARTWFRTDGNLLAGDWLLQTPPEDHWGLPYATLALPSPCSGDGCAPDFGLRVCGEGGCPEGGMCVRVAATVNRTDGRPRLLCAGHSDFLYDEMYRVMVHGASYVDVTSLAPPDGRFEAALRNAITYLSYTGSGVQVRLLFSTITPEITIDTTAILQRLTRDMNPNTLMTVFVGSLRSSLSSWNHSKIVAADGDRVLVGGHNLWTQHYLDKDPVHDLSMRAEGPAALGAHNFANELWRYVCEQKNGIGVRVSSRKGGTVLGEDCPDRFRGREGIDMPGDTTILTMGRFGDIDASLNQSDAGLLAMVRAAKKVVRIAQQDLGPPTKAGISLADWPWPLFDELGAAMARQVDVYVVLANKGAVAGGLGSESAGYSNGWELDEVSQRLLSRLTSFPPEGVPQADVRALICRRFHIAPLRFSEEDTFPDGVALPNHSKLLMVDDQAFYIGSQNLYLANLAEFGFLVDDARAADKVRRSYYAKLWTWASRRERPNAGLGSCSPQME